jgi:hypothetical protein
MSQIAMGSHPEFDALSALADQDSTEAARSRTGRHVAHCESCRAVVEEIRALGDAARAIEVEPAGAELWERIRLAAGDDEARVERAAAERPVVIPAQRDGAARREPSAVWSFASRAFAPRVIGGAGILLAALVAIALWPSRSSLDATGTSRLTFSPGRPVPGGVMTVRYLPARWFRGAPKLVLAGRFVQPSTAPSVRYVFMDAHDGLDSLATLLPTPDGSYEAGVRLPDDFLGVRLAVFDSSGSAVDRDGNDLWVAIGGTRNHAPSLAALIASYTSPDRRQESKQNVSVADSIQRYFPGHPSGWALYDRYGTNKGIFDFLRFFSSAEKKYASLDETLWPKRALDAEQIWAMVSLASKISEPGEQAKWAQRLAREHPEDPRAFRAIAGMVHGIELRDPPHVADSVAPWMPVLDSLYLRSRPSLDPYSYDMTFFRRLDNSGQKPGWSARFAKVRPYFTRGEFPKTADSATEAEVRRRLAQGCAKPAGKFPLPDVAEWTRWCTTDHQLLWTYLADSHLARGEFARARALADSAIAMDADVCSDRMALRTRGDAKLGLGDTVGAARDYAVLYGRWTQQKENRSRATSVLGARFDSVTFDAVADSARRETLMCIRQQKLADSTRSARYRLP